MRGCGGIGGLALVGGLKVVGELFFVGEHVGEGVVFEGVDEGLLGFGEDVFQAACGDDGAVAALFVEAFDDVEVGFECLDDFGYGDVGGIFGEFDAAGAASGGFEVAEFAEVMDDFDDVVAGDVVAFGNFGDGGGFAFGAHVEEYAEAVVGIEC